MLMLMLMPALRCVAAWSRTGPNGNVTRKATQRNATRQRSHWLATTQTKQNTSAKTRSEKKIGRESSLIPFLPSFLPKFLRLFLRDQTPSLEILERNPFLGAAPKQRSRSGRAELLWPLYPRSSEGSRHVVRQALSFIFILIFIHPLSLTCSALSTHAQPSPCMSTVSTGHMITTAHPPSPSSSSQSPAVNVNVN